MILGITGKYCSGKSTVARIFVAHGWYEIDVDRLGYAALDKRAAAVTTRFGREVVDDSGTVDRRKLGDIVFKDKEALEDLESIIHPEMVRLCEKEIRECGRDSIIINAAILHKMGLDRLCDAILWVESPFLRRLGRAFRRDSRSICHVLKRMNAQRKLDAKYYSKDVDRYTIWNGSSVRELEPAVLNLITAMGEKK